jgi:hypothetical protein
MIKVIDNFLSESYFQKIENVSTSSEFEWFSTNNITDDNNPSLGHIGFSHPICVNNNFTGSGFSFLMAGFLYNVLDTIQKKNIVRSRFDMTVHNPNKIMHLAHVDLEEPYTPNITTVFYITDNLDCETVIFDKKITKKEDKENLEVSKLKILKKVQPKKNRLVIFDGSYLHTGHSPVYENKRILINSNFT